MVVYCKINSNYNRTGSEYLFPAKVRANITCDQAFFFEREKEKITPDTFIRPATNRPLIEINKGVVELSFTSQPGFTGSQITIFP